MRISDWSSDVCSSDLLADQGNDWKAIRKNVSAVKATMPKLLHDISSRALHLHGSLGLTHEMPFAEWVIHSFHVGLADGPTEVQIGSASCRESGCQYV